MIAAILRNVAVGLVVGASLFSFGCDQKEASKTLSLEEAMEVERGYPSKSSGEAIIIRDHMGRVVRKHENGFVTTYEYPTRGDRRLPIASRTVRE